MNAIDLLMHDHRVTEKIFSEFKAATRNRWDELLEQVYSELTTHVDLEEHEFYPALARFSADKVDHSIDEHSTIKSLLEDLRKSDKGDALFERRFGDLMMEVEKHIREEEGPGGLMNLAQQNLDEASLMQIGERMELLKTSPRKVA